MSQDKTKLTAEEYLNSKLFDGIENLRLTEDRVISIMETYAQHQLQEAKGEIERLKEAVEDWKSENKNNLERWEEAVSEISMYQKTVSKIGRASCRERV